MALLLFVCFVLSMYVALSSMGDGVKTGYFVVVGSFSFVYLLTRLVSS